MYICTHLVLGACKQRVFGVLAVRAEVIEMMQGFTCVKVISVSFRIHAMLLVQNAR